MDSINAHYIPEEFPFEEVNTLIESEGNSPKILAVGRDNPKIREQMVAKGIDLGKIVEVFDHADISPKDGWPVPIPFQRLMEDMKEDYYPKKVVENWTPGQGAPMKRGKKRR